MPSPEASARANADGHLIRLARSSIAQRLETGRALEVDLAVVPATLREPGACFVTLRREGELRGCIGSLEARRPLAVDAALNAASAAFDDPRFVPVSTAELVDLSLEISILEPSRPLPARTEQELLALLRPGLDGLVLCLGERRATFLPAVWRSLPDPREFVRELKRKAGLSADFWSPGLAFERYEVREIG